MNDADYPKILILHRSVDINLDKSANNIFSTRYQLSILDYTDLLLDSKFVYDIIIKKIIINQNWNELFGLT